MALGNPIGLSGFFDALEVAAQSFTLGEARQINQTGGGHILDASLGSRLWSGEVSLIPAKHQVQNQGESRIELMLEPGASFLAYDKRCTWPTADPTGSILGAATPTLGAVNANNVDVTIAGLPAGYVLNRGDMFGFTYLASPTRRALHRIVTGGTADGSGNLIVQVVPAIRSGYTLGAALNFNKPTIKARVVPGSYKPSSGAPGLLSSGVSFQFVQTLK